MPSEPTHKFLARAARDAERTGQTEFAAALREQAEIHDPERIPNEEFRAAVKEVLEAPEGRRISATELAHRCGWVNRKGSHVIGDATKLQRVVGLKEQINGRGERHRNKTITYDDAVKLTEALGLDPVDMGV